MTLGVTVGVERGLPRGGGDVLLALNVEDEADLVGEQEDDVAEGGDVGAHVGADGLEEPRRGGLEGAQPRGGERQAVDDEPQGDEEVVVQRRQAARGDRVAQGDAHAEHARGAQRVRHDREAHEPEEHAGAAAIEIDGLVDPLEHVAAHGQAAEDDVDEPPAVARQHRRQPHGRRDERAADQDDEELRLGEAARPGLALVVPQVAEVKEDGDGAVADHAVEAEDAVEEHGGDGLGLLLAAAGHVICLDEIAPRGPRQEGREEQTDVVHADAVEPRRMDVLSHQEHAPSVGGEHDADVVQHEGKHHPQQMMPDRVEDLVGIEHAALRHSDREGGLEQHAVQPPDLSVR